VDCPCSCLRVHDGKTNLFLRYPCQANDYMSAKPCENCTMIMVNYADLWLMHTQAVSQLKQAKLELRELKAHCSLLLGACTSCPLLRSDFEACVAEIKDLNYQIAHSSCYSVWMEAWTTCG
jgi:hypothetical protein